jgi:hypothetical protein
MSVNLAQFPCCGGSVHTACAIQSMMATGPGHAACPICHEVLWAQPVAPAVYHYETQNDLASDAGAEATVAARMADPTFRAGVKAVRSKIREAQKATGAMNRLLAARAQQFREAVAPHVAAIRDAKREAQAEIRHMPEVRAATRARAAALRAKTVFAKREHLGYWQVRELFRAMPYGRRRSWYCADPGRRRFWIGI